MQLKRDGDLCTVKGKITPEHKIHKKAYAVCVIVNEKDEAVVECQCFDCAAAKGKQFYFYLDLWSPP